MRTDRVEREGRAAFSGGLGESDCPYKDDTKGIEKLGYWETEAGKRQRWMHGFLMNALNRQVDMQR